MNDKARRRALITGASAGIGRELARLFAQDGHDLVITARGTERLLELAQELKEAHGVDVVVEPADLTDAAAPSALFDALARRGLDVDLLVNNAGFGAAGPFLDLELERQTSMIEVNVAALTKLTHLFARSMVERGFGRVLNIASTAGFQPGPGMAVYYATKAYVISFSEAIAHELKGTGVTVTCHCPGPTATEFGERAGNEKSRLFQMGTVASAERVATDAYRAMQRGRVLAVHGALNWMTMESLRVSPRALTRAAAGWLNQR